MPPMMITTSMVPQILALNVRPVSAQVALPISGYLRRFEKKAGAEEDNEGERGAGDQPRHKQRTNRSVCCNRIDDLWDRRQHKDAERSGDSNNRCTEFHRIAVTHHFR